MQLLHMRMNALKNVAVACGATFLMLGYTGCMNDLDIRPTDQFDGNTVYSSVAALEKGVLGAYAGWDEEYVLRIGSLMADECVIGPNNAGVNGSGQHLFRWSFSPADKDIADAWSNAYGVINRVNRVLDAFDKVPANGEAEVAKKVTLKGELLAIRAFQHFELYRNFGYSGKYDAQALAVPYVTLSDIEQKPSRPTTKDFFQLLEKDLLEAIKLLKAAPADDSRIGPLATHALQARIALYTGQWQEAADAAEHVIGEVPLASRGEFPGIWTDQNNAEVIFRLKRTNQSELRPGDVWKNADLGIIYFGPSRQLLQQYDEDKDIRFDSYFSPSAVGQLPMLIAKYAGTEGAQNLNDIKVFRTAEMYLIRAEAYLHLGNLSMAANTLNDLRAARIEDYTRESFDSKQDLLEGILLERFRELPFEGHRYYDLKRLGLAVMREAEGNEPNQLSGTDLYYYLPLPQAEILANPNIRPNNQGW
jgi:hypothetical protein